MQPQYERTQGVIETNLEDELILLDPGSQEMFSLNESGRAIWRRLPATRDALVEMLLAEYAVARDQATHDVDTLLAALTAAGLVGQSDGGR